jgi:hypothetical protein
MAAGTFTLPVALLIRSPFVAHLIIGGIWTIYFVAQIFGWYRYFVVLRPLEAKAKFAAEKAEAMKTQLAALQAKVAVENEQRQAALAAYQAAYQEGKDALETLRRGVRNMADRRRTVQATLDLGRAQSAAADEPDMAKRLMLQAEAMRRETLHIRSIRLRF